MGSSRKIQTDREPETSKNQVSPAAVKIPEKTQRVPSKNKKKKTQKRQTLKVASKVTEISEVELKEEVKLKSRSGLKIRKKAVIREKSTCSFKLDFNRLLIRPCFFSPIKLPAIAVTPRLSPSKKNDKSKMTV